MKSILTNKEAIRSNSGVPKAARLLLSTAKESGVLFWKQIHPMFEDVSGKLPSDPGP